LCAAHEWEIYASAGILTYQFTGESIYSCPGSVGFAPIFPRYLHWLLPSRTEFGLIVYRNYSLHLGGRLWKYEVDTGKKIYLLVSFVSHSVLKSYSKQALVLIIMSSQLLRLTIDWRNNGTELPPTIQEQQTQNLYSGLRQLRDVEQVDRILDPNVPDGSMGAAWLPDVLVLLTKVLTAANLGYIFNTIRQRLPGTPVNFEIELEGWESKRKTKISMTGVRPENFDKALDQLTNTVKELSDDKSSDEALDKLTNATKELPGDKSSGEGTK
jgi:hypothetical protein